jgi:hypothetical protein
MLQRRRAGTRAAGLAPYVCLALLLCARHPRAALRELLALPRWPLIVRNGLLGPRTDARGG